MSQFGSRYEDYIMQRNQSLCNQSLVSLKCRMFFVHSSTTNDFFVLPVSRDG